MHPERIAPGPGQESVWDYPRPPRIERVSQTIRVEYAGKVIARSTRGARVLETSHPPVYYVPPGDVDRSVLDRSSAMRDTACEFKGASRYFSIAVDDNRDDPAAWSYYRTVPSFESIREWFGFYARVCDCYLGDERVTPQEGQFYGGWITENIVGPFKGGPGTWGW